MEANMILVSACLLGINCRYNGKTKANQAVIDWLKDKDFISFCPESSGHLPIPRLAGEIVDGTGQDVLSGKAKVQNKVGDDYTAFFIMGAEKALEFAKEHNIDMAILKENSPSCGVHSIYDGTFSRKKIKGEGVAAAALAEAGVTLYSEMDLSPDLIERLIREDEK